MPLPTFTPLQQIEPFTIRTFEIDREKKATLPAFIRLMHEAAMQNVIRLKLSVWDLEARGVSWVLLRQRLEIDRLPRLGETISIVTYPSGFDGPFTFRDFRAYDKQERPIAWASSAWVLLDLETRGVRRLPPFILDLLEDIPDPGRCLERPRKRIARPKGPANEQAYRVHYFDLDFNQHLNNTFYLKWMLEALPDAVLTEKRCRSLHLEYRAEALWKDEVRAETQATGEGAFAHRLFRPADDQDLAFAASTWA